MAVKIQFIPDNMVPKPPLPNAAFVAARFVDWSVISSQIAALAADGSLDHGPTGTANLSSCSGKVQMA